MIDPPVVPGVVHLHKERRASPTADRLAELVRAKGLTVFARIEFSSDAATAGLSLRPMYLRLTDQTVPQMYGPSGDM
jgi:hypothetical protein